MLLYLWNLIRGYVVIEVTGFSVERFVNLAIYKGVYIWDMQHKGSAVEMKVSIKAFKMLRSCAKKTKCKIKIINKSGLPFISFRYRKRKVLMLGVVFFVFVMYFLSSFIWLVEIDGCERLSYEQINNFCIEQGLKAGVFKHGVDTAELELMLRDSFKEISWVNIHFKGTKATVRLTESLPKVDIIDRSVPCDIIAKKDGLITSIITSAGSPRVRQKDIVKKGDVLVSGELVILETESGSEKKYVHAEAEVWAKTYYEINLDVPYEYTEKVFTGNIEKDYYINIMGKNINLIKSRNSFMNYDRITSKNQLKFGDNYPLPVILSVSANKEYQPAARRMDIEQAKELADRMVTGRVIREFDFASDIIDKSLEFIDSGDKLEVRAIITVLERIDEKLETVQQQDKGVSDEMNAMEEE